MRPTPASAVRPRLARVRHRLGLDGNELRRDVDRRQRRIGLVLLLLFAAAGWLFAARAGSLAYDRGLRLEQRDAATRHAVTATLTRVDAGTRGRTVTAEWTDAGGAHRIGTFTTWQAVDGGQQRRIWIGADGRPSLEPSRRHERTVSEAVLAGSAAAAAGAGLPLLLAYQGVRRACDRRRYRQWDLEWAEFCRPSTR
ncbi:Rv1733c family protein [Actinomadura parmotrematis]|uniref:DUF3592 domain-containing protein n=1 Tax=Actinomadura parmotrematis TaxID=2864039 RepID=A0ABS7FPW2_9ACTN|nr:hypothetical protein [Actinomadura parmotrematis]MBW8482419.1 hypothetical protein [Actinomadura parmotrematis]